MVRHATWVLFAVLAGAIWLGQPDEAVAYTEIVVYKTLSCGHCSLWFDYLRDNVLRVAVKKRPQHTTDAYETWSAIEYWFPSLGSGG